MNIHKPLLFLALGTSLLISCAGGTTQPPASPTAPPAAPQAAKPDWQQKWDTTLAAAKREGKLMIYSVLSSEVRAAITNAFKEKYGIDLEFVPGRPEELYARVKTERERGLFIPDLLIPGTAPIVMYFKPDKMIEQVPPALILPEVLDSKVWLYGKPLFWDDDGAYSLGLVAMYHSGVLRNTELVKEGQVKSLKDLLRPEWKGKVLLNDPTIGGAGNMAVATWVYAVWGLEETKDYLRQLVKQEVGVSRDTRQQVEWIARGKYAVLLGDSPEFVNNFMSAGAPIQRVRVQESGWITSAGGGLALMKNAPHPNAAIILTNWLLSKEGQTIFARSFGAAAVRVDVPSDHVRESFVPPPGEKLYIENEDGLKGRRDLLGVAREILAPIMGR